MVLRDVTCSRYRFNQLKNIIAKYRELGKFPDGYYMTREITEYVKKRLYELDVYNQYTRKYEYNLNSLASKIYDEVKDKFLQNSQIRVKLCNEKLK